MTLDASTGNAGSSDTKIGLKGGGGDGGTLEGSGGTMSRSSEFGTDLIFSDGRSDGERGTGTGTGTEPGVLMEAGTAAGRRGVRGLLLSELVLESIASSSDSGRGRGGSGGLNVSPTDSSVGGITVLEMEDFFFFFKEDDLCGPSSLCFNGLVERDAISRSASFGVRTTMAPAPRTPVLASIPRVYLGSEMRTGFGEACGGEEEVGTAFVLRDNQCIVVVREGLLAPGEEG